MAERTSFIMQGGTDEGRPCQHWERHRQHWEIA
jgi:hypothetical protein